jgi:hypothetical protein
MISLARTRPLSINIFAAAFFSAAVVLYLKDMSDLPDRQALMQRMYPALTWSRDAVIVWLSAWLSIALIPIAMVWLSAVRFARWMVALFTLAKLAIVLMAAGQPAALALLLQPIALAALLLNLLATAMLFTPASNRWFAEKGGIDPAVFE